MLKRKALADLNYFITENKNRKLLYELIMLRKKGNEYLICRGLDGSIGVQSTLTPDPCPYFITGRSACSFHINCPYEFTHSNFHCNVIDKAISFTTYKLNMFHRFLAEFILDQPHQSSHHCFPN